MLGEFLRVFFDGIWGLFSITWPGFNFTFGQVMLGSALAVGAIGLITELLGINLVSPSGGGSKQKGGNNRKIKISKERKNDTK